MKSPTPFVMKTQVMRALYGLPIDIKIKIFQIAIKANMQEWKLEHSNNYFSSIHNIQWMGKLCMINTSSEELYAATYAHRNRSIYTNYFQGVFTMKNKQPCDYYENINDVTTYEIENNVYDEINIRGNLDKPNQYWAANKCRCLTCDLVRLAYRLDNLWEKSLCPTINKKYARINYTSGNKQWKTMTVSQMKREKDKLRREYRDRINLAKQISN